jgi:hypothetical protein
MRVVQAGATVKRALSMTLSPCTVVISIPVVSGNMSRKTLSYTSAPDAREDSTMTNRSRRSPGTDGSVWRTVAVTLPPIGTPARVASSSISRGLSCMWRFNIFACQLVHEDVPCVVPSIHPSGVYQTP